jgi:crotonobetainyl-CoA:carnitine CoA-transferase CaiB-like acyl-CoA transferase
MGQPALAADHRFVTADLRKHNEPALDAIITAWTATHDRWEITETLQAVGVAAFPSMSNRDLVDDAHLAQRDYFVTLDHPAVGRRVHAGIPWRMTSTPCRVRASAPMPGADTDEILTRILRLSSAEIDRLRNVGAIK